MKCPYDNRPCVVIENLSADRQAVKVASMSRFLPCGHCRKAIHDASRLQNPRLGKWMRRLLTAASRSPEEAQALVRPTCDGRDQIAYQRAMRRLQRLGLMQGYELSPFGRGIFGKYRRHITHGLWIPWDGRTHEAAQEAQRTPAELVKIFLDAVQRHIETEREATANTAMVLREALGGMTLPSPRTRP